MEHAYRPACPMRAVWRLRLAGPEHVWRLPLRRHIQGRRRGPVRIVVGRRIHRDLPPRTVTGLQTASCPWDLATAGHMDGRDQTRHPPSSSMMSALRHDSEPPDCKPDGTVIASDGLPQTSDFAMPSEPRHPSVVLRTRPQRINISIKPILYVPPHQSAGQAPVNCVVFQ